MTNVCIPHLGLADPLGWARLGSHCAQSKSISSSQHDQTQTKDAGRPLGCATREILLAPFYRRDLEHVEMKWPVWDRTTILSEDRTALFSTTLPQPDNADNVCSETYTKRRQIYLNL